MIKNDLTPVEVGQLLVLKSGEFVFVMDVDPMTKMNREDKSRNVSCRFGHIYKKNEQFKTKGMYIGIIEDARNNQTIAVDMSKIKSFTIAELYPMIATCLGKLSDDKMTTFRKIASDYYDNQGW